jgi:hypothetical protein
MRRLLPLPVLFLACATAHPPGTNGSGPPTQAGPDRASFLSAVYEQFPRGGHIVGYGVGQTPEEAEERAQVDAAAQIRSEIQNNSTSIEIELSRGGATAGDQRTVSETVRRVTSDAGAFIRPQRELTRGAGNRWEAVAVASKADLARKYETETSGLRDRLDAIYKRILEDPDSRQVTAALCEVDELERQLDTKDVERRLVTGTTGWTPEIRERRGRVAKQRQEIKSVAQVEVVRGSGNVAAEVWDSLVRELSSRGYSARVVDDGGCATTSGLAVRVAVEQKCGPAPIGGVRCDIVLATRGQRCDETAALFTYSSDRASALHATNNDLAAQAAMRKIDMKNFSRQVAGRVLQALGEGCTR